MSLFIVTNANFKNHSILSPIIVAANYDQVYTGNVHSAIDNIFIYKKKIVSFFIIFIFYFYTKYDLYFHL